MVNTEVFIEGYKLDVQSGLDFSFNYQVSDIRNPETRQTEFSKTVRCPGTEKNNALFGHIFDVTMANPYDPAQPNVRVNFNPNKKAAAQVLVDTLPVFDGIMQLRRIVTVKERIEYEVVFIGRLSNLFTRIASDKINGTYITNENAVIAGAAPIYAPIIDCSDLDHSYTRDYITDTWTAPIGEGVVYPMVDYGESILYYNDGRRVYHVEDMRPAIYLKDLIDRIFAYAESTYSCALFNTTGFKRLIVPLTEKPAKEPNPNFDFKVSKAVRQNLHARSIRSTTLPFELGDHDNYLIQSPTSTTKPRICFEVENNDPVNQWVVLDTASGIVNGTNWSPAASQYEYQIYQFHRRDSYYASVDLVLQINDIAEIGPPANYVQRLQILHYRSLTGVIEVVGETEFTWDLPTIMGAGEGIPFFKTVIVQADNIDTYALDAVWVAMDGNGTLGYRAGFGTPVNSNTTTALLQQVIGGVFYNTQYVDELFEGDTYTVNRHLPDVSMRDLLVSVFRMFNLHLTPSKDIENHYIIETWQEFYQSGTARDWTKKLDHASPIELQPMGLLAAREYMFQYREDGDYYNARYQSNHGRTYGSRRFEVDNDFVPKRNTVEVIFSPTPLNNDHGSNRLVSKIYDADISEGARPTDANIRVLYYAGLLPSTPSWRFRSGYPPAVGLDTLQTQYPYAGHLNHPITPTFDLSWGMPFELFYGANDYISTFFYTNANLFNLYHISQYREIIDKDSQLMTAYFYLETIDILKLDFRDTIMIDNQYWRLNRVLDYNPFNNGLTKVELIKALQLEPFKAVEFNGASGGRPRGSSRIMIEQSPKITDTMRGRNGNISPSFVGDVSGFDNKIDGTATSFSVKGDRNKIGAGTTNVLIVGSDNVVGAGLHNVTILNGTGVVVSKSNVTIINGAETVLFGGIIEGSEDEVRAIGAPSPIFVIDGGEDVVSDTFADYHNDINGGSDSV